jgi:hypothetical protein
MNCEILEDPDVKKWKRNLTVFVSGPLAWLWVFMPYFLRVIGSLNIHAKFMKWAKK